MSQDSQSAEVALLREIRDLLRTLAGHTPATTRRALTVEDRRVLAILLPTISRSTGDALFTLRDLTEQAQTDDALKLALGCVSARRMGKLFARSAGFAINGVHLERVGNVREGILWRIARQ